MKNKTYRFAVALAVLLTLCLVFMMPVGAEVVLPDGVTEHDFGENTVTDGTTYYATLDAAVKAIDDAKTSGAILYCKPNSNVGSLYHTPVCSTLTIHGNGATVDAGGERDFDIGNTDPNSGNDVTADMTLTVKNLNGCGAWGNKATEHTVTLIFENCKDMGKIYLTGTTGILNIYLTDCSFTSNDNGGGNCKVYSNANGDISLTGVEFSNVDKAVNLNHKVAGTQTVTITDCTFTNCGDDVDADEIPVRVLSSVDGGISALTISDCTFSGTPEGGADILLDYGIGTTSVSISETAAGILVETASNDGTIKTITDTETFSQNAVAKIGNVEYLTLQAAINAVQEGETITLLGDVTVTTAAYGQNALNHARAVSFTLDLDENTLSADTGNSVFRFNIADSGATSDVTVTIKNGKIVAGGNTWCAVMSSGLSADVKAILKLEDLTIYGYKAGDLAVKAWGNGVVNAERVTIYANNGAGGFYAVGGEITLYDCTVEQKGLHTTPYNSMAFAVSNGGTMTVNSGTYSAEPTTADEGNNQGSSHGSWCGGVMNSGGNLIINGGTFSNDNFGDNSLATYARGLILADTGANIDINGGTFNALKSIIDVTNNLGDASNNPSVTLSGGAFSADPRISGLYASELITVEENYVCVGPTDGKYTVEEANPEITVTPTDGVSSTLEVGYEQPEPQIITVKNDGNVELTLAITKTGFENITITGLPESKLLATSESFSFTVQLDAGLAAGTYSGTITLSNESIENKVIPVSFTVSDPTSEEGAPGTTSPGSGSSSGKDTGSGNFQYYPRSVPADGIIDFGTSPVVTGMEVPVGSTGTVTLNTKPTFAMPEDGFYIFEIDAPGYNTEAKINGGIAFKISLAKIEEAGWTENDVVLFHGTVAEDGKITWEALPTNLVKVENGIAYYKAAINGCSPFYIGFVEEGSIVNTEVVDPVTPPIEEPDVPGTDLPDIPGVQDEPEEPSSPAPVLGLLAALGAAVALRRK